MGSFIDGSDRAVLRQARIVIVPAFLLVAAFILAAVFCEDPGQRKLFDNLHWTLSYSAAALLAWRGVRASDDADRAVRKWFAWGLTLYALGQWSWDLQVASGWNPFPGPSDLAYLSLGILCGVGLGVLLARGGTPIQRKSAVLDVVGLSVAVLALTLSLYLSKHTGQPLLQMSFLVAYPVVLSCAACMGLIIPLTLHLKPRLGPLLFGGALFVQSALWLQWNALTLDAALRDGTVFNAAFSITALAQGLGVLLWKTEPSTSPRWVRFSEGFLRLLPLIIVVLAAMGVLEVMLNPQLPPQVVGAAVMGGLLVVILATLRQSLLLGERERLMEAELALRATRTNADEALRKNEEKYRTLVEQAADGIFITDADSRCIDANTRGAAMLGFTIPEVIGRTLDSVLFEEELGKLKDTRAELQSAGTSVKELKFRRRDGTAFWGEINASRLSDGRNIGVVRDVSERKRTEAERLVLEARLQESQKLETVGTMASGIAHDFNNILMVIRGNVELALHDLPHPAPARASLEAIRTAGNRASRLVRQILAFAGQQSAEVAPVKLSSVVDEAVELLRSTMPSGIGVTCTFDDDAPPVLADATQIHQVVINLCTNAWHAIDGIGTVNVKVSRAKARLERYPELAHGDWALLSVSDTGRGMSAETSARVFEPFFSTKEPGQGTGLGLWVVHNIVKGRHGVITVTTAPGAGTTFDVYLPAAAPAAAAPQALPARAPAAVSARRLLYVDDEAAVVLVMKRLLERRGHKVTGFVSAELALAAIESDPHSFDILATDYNMPKISGLELIRRVRALRADARLVLTSGVITDELRAEASKLGVEHLIYKAASADELCDEIDRIALSQGA